MIHDLRISEFAIFMVIARMHGQLPRGQIAGIRTERARLFYAKIHEAEDLTVIGKWLVQERR